LTPAQAPLATIVISTKNRRDELRAALASCLTQSVPVEVLVFDDGSTDGTSDMVRAEFPSFTLHRFETSAGYIPRRNQGASLGKAPIFISIDDDATFPSPRTVEQTLADFSDPRIGAVAIPYIDTLFSQAVKQRSPDPASIHILSEFRGTACALRRDLFLELGGWREMLFHQSEEDDYCLRMLAAGYLVRAGNADPIPHNESPSRDLTRLVTFNARNNLLFVWHHVPARVLLPHMTVTAINLLRHGFKVRYPRAALRGMRKAVADIVTGRAKRKPVPMTVYRVHRWLRHRGATPIAEVQSRLGAGSSDGQARS